MKDLLEIIRKNFVSWFWICFLVMTAVYVRSDNPQAHYDIRICREILAQCMLAGFFLIIISGLIPQIREYKSGLIAVFLGWILWSNMRAVTQFSLHSMTNVALWTFLFFATVRYMPALDIEKVLKFLSWMVVFQCFFCAIQYLQYDSIFFDALGEKGHLANRPVGTLENESVFGAYLSFLIPLCFCWRKWKWNVAGIIGIIFLIASKSITAIVGGFVGMMMLIFMRSEVKRFGIKVFRKKRFYICFRKAFSIVVMLLIIGGIGVYKFNIVDVKKTDVNIKFKDKSFYHFDLHNSGRFQHWKESLQMGRRTSWFGFGIGNYKPYMGNFMKGQTAKIYGQAHNSYLQILCELGIIGLSLFLMLLIYLLKGMWGATINYTYMKSVTAGFTAFLVNMIGWFPERITHLIAPIFFFVCISEIVRRR